MADVKKAGRKGPVDRSDNAAEFPATRVPNVIKREHLETGESKDRVGKSTAKKS